MTGRAKNVVRFTLKEDDRAFIAATYFPEDMEVSAGLASTQKHCVSHVITGLDQILSNLPNGSRITLEAKYLKNSGKGKKQSAKGRKKKKKKSPRTGRPKQNTSKGAAKKAKTST